MQKNYLPFDDEYFDKIAEDAFDPEAEIHVFSDRYQKRKVKLMKKNTENNNRKPVMTKKRIAAVAAAAAIAAAVPTSVFAGSRIYNAFMDKPAKYQREITIDLGEPTEAAPLSADAPVIDSGVYTMKIGWVPEDLSEDNDKSFFACYSRYDIDDWRAVEFSFFQIDDESRTFNETLNGVVYDESYETDDKIVFISDLGDGRIVIWVAFKNTKYVANILALQEFTDEELHKMADGLTLEESDTETASSYKVYKEYQEKLRQELAEPADNTDEWTEPKVNMDNMKVISVGETAGVTWDDVDITINSVKFQDNFEEITTEGIGLEYDFSKYLDADGTLADNVRTWYKYGDGVNTIDEAVETEIMPARIMVVDLTYENKGSEEIEYCVCPSLITIDDEGNVVYPFIRDNMYCEDSLSHLTYDNHHFSFYTEHESSKNNIASFKPGEKADVQLAFIVYEDELSDLYLQMNSYGNNMSDSVDNGCLFLDISSLSK